MDAMDAARTAPWRVRHDPQEAEMNWGFWLTIAVVVSVLFAVFGLGPRGGRPVANSRLMNVARVALLVIIAVLFYFFLQDRAAH